jgi:23S rRNA pseudouridine1911/1915/1917 synthase
VVGDPVYLRRIPAISRALPDPQRGACLDFPRQALHAATLGFRHPATGETLRFETPLPPDFQDLVTLLS